MKSAAVKASNRARLVRAVQLENYGRQNDNVRRGRYDMKGGQTLEGVGEQLLDLGIRE